MSIPLRVAETNGLLDLDAEAERLGATAVEYALSRLLSTYEWRVERGAVAKDALALDLIKRRKFPSYVYATIDEAWANRRLLQHRKHKPLGLTCCLDEAAIFVALVLILSKGIGRRLCVYRRTDALQRLSLDRGGRMVVLYQARAHSASGWSKLVAEAHAGDAQAAFDDRLRDFDRIITASGTHTFATGETSIAPARLAEIVRQFDAFFGVRLSQLDRALERRAQPVPAPHATWTAQGVWSASNAKEVQARIRRAALDEGNPAALRALYGFRTLDLPDLQVYLRAARRGTRVRDLFAPIATIDDAVRFVAAISGSTSIFDDPDRIAMPDETARLGTGTDRDKALLLHVLLEHALAVDDPGRARLETLFTDAGSFVRSARFCISTTCMARVSKIEGTILYRIADFPVDVTSG